MLQQILQALRDGGGCSVEELARQLGVTPALVNAALEQLERMGLVRRVVMSLHCTHGCPGCTGGCPLAGPAAVRWELPAPDAD